MTSHQICINHSTSSFIQHSCIIYKLSFESLLMIIPKYWTVCWALDKPLVIHGWAVQWYELEHDYLKNHLVF